MQGKRGRKSAASLEIANSAIELVQRPRCPPDLDDEEGEIWIGIVNRMPSDWFPTETHPLLIQYCRHTIQARKVAGLIKLEIAELDRLLKMQERESKALATLGTKLRIAQQSTFNHRGNARQITPQKPWQS